MKILGNSKNRKNLKKLLAFLAKPWYINITGGCMSEPKFIEIKRSMHVYEYKREDYNDIVGSFKEGYVTVSQFADSLPKNLKEVNWNNFGTDRIKEPKCSIGQFLFGIEDNGDLTQLTSIIDSSD